MGLAPSHSVTPAIMVTGCDERGDSDKSGLHQSHRESNCPCFSLLGETEAEDQVCFVVCSIVFQFHRNCFVLALDVVSKC